MTMAVRMEIRIRIVIVRSFCMSVQTMFFVWEMMTRERASVTPRSTGSIGLP